MRRSFLAALTCLGVMGPAAAADAAWVQTWGASPQPPSAARGPFPATPSFSDQTVRQVVRISAGGRVVQLRLSNEYGTAPLTIGAAHVAIAGKEGAIRPGTDRVVTFGGKPTAVIPAGAPLLSDPVALDAPALSRLSVSLYLPKDTGPCTCHATGMQTAYVTGPGDQTGAADLSGATKVGARAFLSGIGVDSPVPAKAIVAFGDSITDGVGSTPDADHRWPDLLADRLARKHGMAFGIVNEGISGNRLLHDGAGVSALARFDRDVLSVPGAAYVIVFEGVNDLGLSDPPPQMTRLFGSADPVTAEDLIGADKQMIARAHARGLKIFGATIAPYKGASYWTAEGEAKRQAINAWIRKGGAFDGVIDFDAVLRDPSDPAQIKDGLHAGDHLHGSDKGYAAMAAAIDLRLFGAADRPAPHKETH